MLCMLMSVSVSVVFMLGFIEERIYVFVYMCVSVLYLCTSMGVVVY